MLRTGIQTVIHPETLRQVILQADNQTKARTHKKETKGTTRQPWNTDSGRDLCAQDIRYSSDISLLNEARKRLEGKFENGYCSVDTKIMYAVNWETCHRIYLSISLSYHVLNAWIYTSEVVLPNHWISIVAFGE
jgi:hypothetical protein